MILSYHRYVVKAYRKTLLPKRMNVTPTGQESIQHEGTEIERAALDDPQ